MIAQIILVFFVHNAWQSIFLCYNKSRNWEIRRRSQQGTSEDSTRSDCVEIFSSDEAKSAVNTLCIDEHFCKIWQKKIMQGECMRIFWGDQKNYWKEWKLCQITTTFIIRLKNQYWMRSRRIIIFHSVPFSRSWRQAPLPERSVDGWLRANNFNVPGAVAFRLRRWMQQPLFCCNRRSFVLY